MAFCKPKLGVRMPAVANDFNSDAHDENEDDVDDGDCYYHYYSSS